MHTFITHKRWLMISGGSIFGFGLLGFLGTMPATHAPVRWIMDLLAFPIDGWPTWQSPEIWFVSALSGGFLAGWGAMILCAGLWLHDLAAEPTRRMVMTSLVSWFLIDSAGSVAAGVWQNAVWNVFVLLFLMGPLWRSATHPTTQPSEK